MFTCRNISAEESDSAHPYTNLDLNACKSIFLPTGTLLVVATEGDSKW